MQGASDCRIADDAPQVSEPEVSCVKRDGAGASFILNLNALKSLRQ